MNTLFEIGPNRKDEWLTPPYIVKSLGEFDLDPCSPINRPWTTAKNHYTELDNGLTKSWFGRVWCNPPYSDLERWLKKCSYHQNCIALTFARVDTRLFQHNVFVNAYSLFFFKGRLQFYHVDGTKPKVNAGAPSVLISFNEENAEAIDIAKLNGTHIPLFSNVFVVGTTPTWISIVKIAVRRNGNEDLKALYEMVERIAPDKVQKNQHWKAKVRQQIQRIRKSNEEICLN